MILYFHPLNFLEITSIDSNLAYCQKIPKFRKKQLQQKNGGKRRSILCAAFYIFAAVRKKAGDAYVCAGLFLVYMHERGIFLRKQICCGIGLLTAAITIGAGSYRPVQGAVRDGNELQASPFNASYQRDSDKLPSWDELLDSSSFTVHVSNIELGEKTGAKRMARSSRASNVLTITGSGTHEMMQSVLGDPGVYLLFQGANYRPGFNKMISDHTIDGSSRQIDAIWEYYDMNGTHTVQKPKTKIWKGSGSYANAEEVLVADSIVITNSTDNGSGKWNTTVQITNPHPKLTGVVFYYYAPYLQDYGGVTIFPITEQQAVTGAQEAHTHIGTTRTEPSCTTSGKISGTCEMCGEVSETIPALGHSVPAGYDSTTVPGYKIKVCQRCERRLETIPNTYQLIYEGNGADGGSTQSSSHQVGTGFQLKANGFVRRGYEYSGWNSQPSGQGTQYQENQTVQDLTLIDGGIVRLYAQWTPKTYTVFFDPAGGNCSEEQRQIIFDQPYGTLPEPKKTDYQFLGWQTEETAEFVTDETRYQKDSDTILIASWKLQFEDMENGTNRRPGSDGIFGTEDDHYYYNGKDGQPGTEDDIPLSAGADGEFGTGDDYYQNSGGSDVHAGLDTIFDTADDYIDNGDGTNRRPGEDQTWGTDDDEKWWNGEDGQPGTEDDKQIHPGADGEYGTPDDYIDNGDGTNRRPGEDQTWGTDDDEKWWNGEDGQPGTEDDKQIEPGQEEEPPGKGEESQQPEGEDHTAGETPSGGDGSMGGSGTDGSSTDGGSGGSAGSSGGSGWSTAGGSSSGGSGLGGPGTSGSYVSLLGHGKTGEWEKLPEGWIFRYTDGSRAKSTWDYLYYGVTGRTDWYRFGDDEYMKTGWYQDTDGSWYFLHTISDGTLGHMQTGWHLDSDGYWYYLNPVSDGHRGAMYTDWHLIDGKWYYFNPVSDGTKGAMYAGRETPDGYWVGDDGAWTENVGQ